MFAPGEIVYGWVKILHTPKYKYAVSLFRDGDLNILAQFTTSKNRVGYVFEAGAEIGIAPDSGNPFSFPRKTTITFDYGFIFGSEQKLSGYFDAPIVVCKMYEKQYIELVYALYKSPDFPDKYRTHLETVLENYFGSNKN